MEIELEKIIAVCKDKQAKKKEYYSQADKYLKAGDKSMFEFYREVYHDCENNLIGMLEIAEMLGIDIEPLK
jgi:hypothetical protein